MKSYYSVRQIFLTLTLVIFFWIIFKTRLFSDYLAENSLTEEDILKKLEIEKSKCVPRELLHLTTKYSARLCESHHLWPANSTSLESLACKYPRLNPFAAVITKYMGKSVKRNLCKYESKFPKLFTTDYNSSLLTLRPPEMFGFYNCCYRSLLQRNLSTWSDFRSPKVSENCTPITSPTHRVTDEFIKIICYQNQSEGRGRKEVVVDFVAFVQPKLGQDKTNNNNHNFLLHNHLNVAILGLDGVSHMNLIRTMPKSYEYIREELNAFGFFGYNSVGDSTFPNIMAIMTGYDKEALTGHKCHMNRAFDECPFVWKDFSQKGYYTIFGEDASFLGTFHYAKKGFKKPPTDYYLRPYFQSTDAVYRPGHYDFPCWAGPRLYFEHLLDYMKSLAVTMAGNSSHRYFQHLWESALTHSFLNRPVAGDEVFRETLQWFKLSNYLNNTFLILMSDHGMKYEGLRKSIQGKVESQMPFLFFIIPQWFQNKYPQATKNLRENKFKLTTPYDVHWTLRDLLQMNIEDEEVFRRLKYSGDEHPSQFGQSLFLPISETRECPEAGVPIGFCSCQHYEPVSTNMSLTTELANFIVFQINWKLKDYIYCANLKLQRVLNAYRLVDNIISSKNVRKSTKRREEFMLSIETAPGNATFEAQVSIKAWKEFQLQGSIKRTNKYNNESYCVNVYELKHYCFCQDKLYDWYFV